MRRCRNRLVQLVGGGPEWTAILFTGSGTAAVEAAICSAVPAEGGVLVVNNGVYGDRMLRITRAHGIRAEPVSCANTSAIDPREVDCALRRHPELSHVSLVHHETTTGLLNPVGEVARVAAGLGRRVMVDAMSSLFGESLGGTPNGIDLVTAS